MAALGLITVLYKSDAVLEDFFRSIHRQQYTDYCLYLVDNSASPATDAILEKLGQQYPLNSVVYINTGANIGVAAGNNVGIHRALADGCSQLLILNNDIVFEDPQVFNKMMSRAAAEPLIATKVFYFDNDLLWMAGGHMDRWRALGVHAGMNQPDGPAFSKARYITYAPTCFMLVNKEVFAQTGFMDEKYFAYYDDTDFVWRALEKGYKLFYEPAVAIRHKVSSSGGGDFSPFYIYYGNRNKIYFIRKNLKGFRKYFALGYTLLSRIAFWLRYDGQGKKKLISALKDGFAMPLQ